MTRLQVAWTYHAGDGRADNRSEIQCNPLIIDGVLYGTTPALKLVALDAVTGHELWRFNPFTGDAANLAAGVNRGVVYWADGNDRRILFVANHYLHEIDAIHRETDSLHLANPGRVDIQKGLGHDGEGLFVVGTSPGVVYHDLLIIAMRVSEGPGPTAPGHIRAFDIRTGKMAWIFHTIPQPGEPGYETWPPDAWKYMGAANCWTGMTLDEKRGLVFVPTGSAAFDFWGGNRIGQDLYANCLLALDAATGRLVWHYQFVHHDLWDRDLPAPPNLLTLRRNGKTVDAVAQITKSAHIFVFNRETGEPLFPIVERGVPASDLQGESAWPTQRLPAKPAPFGRQLFTADEITDISPESHQAVLDRFVKLRPHLQFMPPSREGTIIFPGFDGGGEWGGAAVDPAKGVMYVNASEMPWIITMAESRRRNDAGAGDGERIYGQICAVCHGPNRSGDPARAFPPLKNIGQKMKSADIVNLLGTGKGRMPAFAFLSAAQKEAVAGLLLGEKPPERAANAADSAATDALGREPYTHTGYNRWLDPQGYPAVKPPWGTLNAIDLNTGEYVWRTTLGEFPELKAKGIPPTGTENYGGPVVTAGGLIFIAASRDEMLHAFDQKSGKLLWQSKLPAGGYATPATYMLNGRQYVVIACGGGKMGTKSGDAYVAFALPR